MTKYYFIIILSCWLFTGCQNKHLAPSADLKKAYSLQQEALKINQLIDSILMNPQGLTQVSDGLIKRKSAWLENMIEVPDMEHDHSNCNHDHTRQTINLTDQEMVVVQQVWLDTILQISSEIK